MAASISEQQILQAALTVIAERGYAGATTKQIALVAGINEVTLFRRFGSKKELMRRLVEREAARLGSDELVYSGDLRADLGRIVGHYQKLMQARGHVVLMLMSEVPKQPDLREVMAAPQAQARRIATILARYQADGQLVTEPPMRLLGSLIGPLFFGSMLGSLEPSIELSAVEPERHVDLFLQGHGLNAAQ